ncbi:BPSS1780 family membrane protein [Aquabacterium sp.]|uniref:BPSS1780 family membrane protein n=1 Tax=Aquabacterium sp. TaxID=1872578 RepID=UPI0035ADF155
MVDAAKPDVPLTGVKLRVVPALQGSLWVKHGLRAFFQQPLGFAGLYGAVVFAGMLLMSIPVIGTVAVIALTPTITLAFMRAVQFTLSGQRFGVTVLIDVWRAAPQRRQAQIKLGLLYCVCVAAVLVLLAATASNTTALKDLLNGTDAAREAALQDPALLRAMLLSMLAYVPVSIAFWHAPALVQWAGQSVGKALFFSIMACWHNRWAFTMFGLAWGGVVFMAATIAATLATALQSPQALELAMIPIAVIFGASFYASLYFSIVDCFEQKAPDSINRSA